MRGVAWKSSGHRYWLNYRSVQVLEKERRVNLGIAKFQSI